MEVGCLRELRNLEQEGRLGFEFEFELRLGLDLELGFGLEL